jgi:hypothetical protein
MGLAQQDLFGDIVIDDILPIRVREGPQYQLGAFTHQGVDDLAFDSDSGHLPSENSAFIPNSSPARITK